MSDRVFSSIASEREGNGMYLLVMFINGKFMHRLILVGNV